jgi:hypothetical protein
MRTIMRGCKSDGDDAMRTSSPHPKSPILSSLERCK